MTTYRLGSRGEEVRTVQERLRALELYLGPVDGVFGGGTAAAVRRFQASRRLEVDGAVGPATWQALVGDPPASEPLSARPIAYRCLALTGAFETGAGIPDCFAGISGDFDGQGISLGVCQWNFGQGSVQPLLQEMLDGHAAEARAIFGDDLPVLAAALASPHADQMAFARSLQHPVRHFVYEPWRGMFRALGRTRAFQDIQVAHASRLFQAAGRLAAELGVGSERAVALLFDIVVQNGSISALVKARIQADVAALPATLAGDALEVEKLRIIANRRAEASNPIWVEDVRARKLCCANGGGAVHGIAYDLEEQFGIGLRPAAARGRARAAARARPLGRPPARKARARR